MRTIFTIGLALCLSFLASCSTTASSSNAKKKRAAAVKSIPNVRTTAYTHTEADHIQYGRKAADGSTLKFGQVRSAAADWSVYPVGTIFKVQGQPYLYEVDDYGSALVGTNTLDLYKPDHQSMNNWGVKRVDIDVVRWGSYQRSLEIMRPRTKHNHVRQMVARIESKR